MIEREKEMILDSEAEGEGGAEVDLEEATITGKLFTLNPWVVFYDKLSVKHVTNLGKWLANRNKISGCPKNVPTLLVLE